MAVLNQVVRYGNRRLGWRVARAAPWVGGLIALVAVAGAIRRKGFVGGTVDTALNAIPIVGGVKGVAEMLRGRDFIPNRRELGRLTARSRLEEQRGVPSGVPSGVP